MDLYSNRMYLEDINVVSSMNLPWELIKEKTVMLSGATGLIGSFLVDVIMEKNNESDLSCTVIALGRDEERAKKRFNKYFNDRHFAFISYDVKKPLDNIAIDTVDYILHLASNTHPVQYAKDPIGTITTNIVGLQNMLDFADTHNTKRFVFASSNEIYGENRGDVELFDESYCGYIDSNTLRAGYPESKRCGEALCQAYIEQKGIDIVIPRFTRSYGPTMKLSDTKALSQFIKKGIAKEDIVLKSEGTQYYSYTYVADAVSGVLTILMKGEKGEAYNIADEGSDIRLRDLARIVAEQSGNDVIYELPDSIEAAGFSKATKARLNGNKLKRLGWCPIYRIEEGVERTIEILKQVDMN